MSSLRLRKGAAIFGAGAMLVALVACSGDGGNGGDPTTTTEPEVNYPPHALEYIVPYNPGGSTDPVGREFSRMLAEELGTSATVQNLPGGDETIGMTAVFDAEPDGTVLGLSSATGIIVQPLVNDALKFKSYQDFDVVVKMVEAPNAILVRKDSPYQSLDDLIADAKARPGQVRIGTTGRLTNNSFTIAGLEAKNDIEVTIVPFSGGAGEAVLATLSGEIEAVVPTAAGQLGHIQSGDLRALAHTGPSAYNKFLPGAISLPENGYELSFSSDYVTVTAKGMSEAARAKLVEAALKVAASEEWAAWCEDKGFLSDARAGADLEAWLANAQSTSETAIKLMDEREK